MRHSTPELLLDSNVFGDREFLMWLRGQRKFSVGVPVIAFVEVFLRSLRRRMVSELETILRGIHATVIPLDRVSGEEAARQAVSNPSLPFGLHARDYLVGAAALSRRALLVTYNKKHFGWMKELIRTPRELHQTYRSR